MVGLLFLFARDWRAGDVLKNDLKQRSPRQHRSRMSFLCGNAVEEACGGKHRGTTPSSELAATYSIDIDRRSFETFDLVHFALGRCVREITVCFPRGPLL